MRDPTRIKTILDKLNNIWQAHPDQRFYQLLINIGLIPDSQLWHIEDEDIIAHLNKSKWLPKPKTPKK